MTRKFDMADNLEGTDHVGRARERGRAFHRPGRALEKKMRMIASKRGFAEPDVLMRWEDAVGPALSEICTPVKVTYGESIGATLLVQTTGARALEVEHRKPQILEAINRFYGYRAISRLRITQTKRRHTLLVGFAEDEAKFEPAPAVHREPRPEDVRRAETLAGSISDPALRAALTKMGAWVLARPNDDHHTGRQSDD